MSVKTSNTNHCHPKLKLSADSRRFLFFSSVYLLLFTTGLYYSFALFSLDVKSFQGYTQLQINTIGGSTYFIPMALVYPLDSFIRKYSPESVNNISILSFIIGWSGLIASTVHHFHWILFLVFLDLVAFGSVFTYPCVLSILKTWTNEGQYNFHLVFMTGIYSLASGALSIVYDDFSVDPSIRFRVLSFIGFLLGVFCQFSAYFFIRSCSSNVYNDDTTPQTWRTVSTGGIVYDVSPRISLSINSAEYRPLLFSEKASNIVIGHSATPKPHSTSVDDFETCSDHQTSTTKTSESTLVERPETRSLFQIPHFWFGFFMLFLAFGVSVGLYHNIGILLQTLHYPFSFRKVSFVCYSIGLTGGRLGFSKLIEWYSNHNQGFRFILPFVMTICTLGICCVQFSVLYFSSLRSFVILITFNSIFHGGICPIISYISFAYGDKLFHSRSTLGQLYAIFLLAQGIGPTLFDMLSGYLFDISVQNHCSGISCFQTYFYISIASTNVALICALSFWFYVRKNVFLAL